MVNCPEEEEEEEEEEGEEEEEEEQQQQQQQQQQPEEYEEMWRLYVLFWRWSSVDTSKTAEEKQEVICQSSLYLITLFIINAGGG